uniref:protein-serine/threonine phosphatase n=1 Tax=Magallana gigas TaxID=29159 RepID=A0A8W8NAR0_MAGGI
MAKSKQSKSVTCTPEELDDIITAPSGGLQMLPSNAYDEVYPRIYVGEESIGKSRVGLRDLGITHVVNTAMGKGQFYVNTNHVMFQKVGIKFYGFEAMDMLNFQLTPFFEKSADFIEHALKEEGKVMVHCKVGASRSATIVIAFLMIKRHMTVQEAVRMVRSKREIAPNEGFDDDQLATCSSNSILQQNGFRCEESCTDSCWHLCMVENFGQINGSVSSNCFCSRTFQRYPLGVTLPLIIVLLTTELFQRFDNYQLATCSSNSILQQNGFRCENSCADTCWHLCMVEKFGQINGSVSREEAFHSCIQQNYSGRSFCKLSNKSDKHNIRAAMRLFEKIAGEQVGLQGLNITAGVQYLNCSPT